MKRALLLIVVPALLVVLGFAQIPAANINTDQTKIKGCLSGTDGNYTVAEDNTGHLFKITTSSVDLKPHVGHDVTIIGQTVNGVSSAAADSSIAVTELNMISEHCSAAAAAPAATVSTPSENAVIPPAAAAAAPVATASPSSETASTPAAAGTAPAATASPSSETASTPAAPAGTVTISPETASTPVASTAHSSRLPARPRTLPAKTAAAPATPDAAASTSSEADSKTAATPTTPAAAVSTSSEAASAPAAAPITAKAAAKGGSLWILILCAVLVIVIGTMAPLLSRWRKRKMLARTGAQNLSFTNEASPEQDKSAPPITRKAA